ncbi:MAG: SUMF1/EgtB/PvdO family nonheme iron enzyme [Planctomycetia bacterium]|nr:SUMF1/EgtB/PvdO family nonheme iron enzyme [Planctomycetia bacterium]
MKKLGSVFLLIAIPCLVLAEEAIRTWKSKTGETIIEAKWDSEKDSEKDSDPETVFFLKNGKRYKIPLKNLSKEDRKYVTDGRAKKAQRSGKFGLEEVTDEKPKNPFEMRKARKFALLVGVTDYAEMSGLACCAKDIHAIREQLIKLGFKENDIYMLESGKAMKDLPSRRNILERLDLVLGQVKVGDMVFFAFAGHGAETGKEQYICPAETELDNLSETAVPIPLILEKLDASDARFKWLVVDACRNNPFNRRVPGATTLQGIDNPPEGVLLLQSCGQDEYSHEDTNLGQGIFTASFVEALAGKADLNQDGTLTLMEVCSYTTEATNRRALDLFQKYQRPYLNGDVTDFVLTEDLNRPKAIAHFDAARKLRREKKYDEAKVEIDKALDLYDKDQDYLDERGIIDGYLDAIAKQKELERKALEEAEARKKAEEEAKRLASIPRPVPGSTPQILPTSDGRTAGERMVKTINGVEYAFRWCPAGSFMMGSPSSETGRDDDETQHRVTLTKGFWMLETEVTQAMWESVMGDNPSNFKGSDLPVEKVSWDDCQEFCQKLRSQGLNVQLPTEAQWEYACRAGTTTALNNGKNLTDEEYNCAHLNEVAWYDWQNENMTTHVVGQKKPNAWGLYDMHGNVWEWCADWKGDYPSYSVTDPTGPASGSYRVNRGGCWVSSAKYCRSANRDSNTPTDRYSDLGFRPVLVP